MPLGLARSLFGNEAFGNGFSCNGIEDSADEIAIEPRGCEAFGSGFSSGQAQPRDCEAFGCLAAAHLSSGQAPPRDCANRSAAFSLKTTF